MPGFAKQPADTKDYATFLSRSTSHWARWVVSVPFRNYTTILIICIANTQPDNRKNPVAAYNTFEGRPVYYVKISDNPNDNEEETRVLYTGMHHAREPISLQQMLFFMYHLLENYETDPYIKQLIDNTELYFIPCLNPDGYEYNRQISPNGAGCGEKNRRDNLNSSYGLI